MADDLNADLIAWEFARDPADLAWLVRPAATRNHFSDLFGELRVRADGETTARLRLMPMPHHLNLHGTVHGGTLLGAIDQAVFVCGPALGIERIRGGVTIDLTTQFMAPPAGDRPYDVTVEFLRLTGRLAFVRGVVEQEGALCVAYSVTVRRG